MKFLILLLSLVLVNKNCDKSEVNQDHISLEYTASSRSTYKRIIINRKTITRYNTRELAPISTPCNHDHWKKIIRGLKK